MSIRTFCYSITVLLAASVVATTAASHPGDELELIPKTSHEQPASPAQEPGSRLVILVAGIGAVGYTFRRAYQNMR